MTRLGGQTRSIVAGDSLFSLGWDMTAALALASALGLDLRLVAEMLPEIEAAAMVALNDPDGQSADPSESEESE